MLYVSDQPNNALLVVDLSTQAVADKIDLGESPEGGASPPTASWSATAVEISNSVALIRRDDQARLANIKVEGKNPEHAVFSPDGKWIFVSAEEATQVDIIDVAQRKQVANVPVGRRPRGIGFLPDSSKATSRASWTAPCS